MISNFLKHTVLDNKVVRIFKKCGEIVLQQKSYAAKFSTASFPYANASNRDFFTIKFVAPALLKHMGNFLFERNRIFKSGIEEEFIPENTQV